MSEDRLTVIPGGAEDAGMPLRTRPRGRFCTHDALELDTDVRRVYCAACKREVDTFDALLRLVNGWERYVHARDRARQEAKAAQARLDELKRQERNAKARLRRAGGDDARRP